MCVSRLRQIISASGPLQSFSLTASLSLSVNFYALISRLQSAPLYSNGRKLSGGVDCKMILRSSASTILMVILCFIAFPRTNAASVNPSRQLWNQLRPPPDSSYYSSLEVCSQMCKNDAYEPVCGNDMKTYPNECSILYLRLCKKMSRLKIYRRGKCPRSRRRRTRTCFRRRMEIIQQIRRFPSRRSSYIPVCRENGSFKRIQCHAPENVCFCVHRRTGKKRIDTVTRYPKLPKCGGKRRKSRVDRCSPTLRKQFNDNLIRQFKIEFKRLVKRKHVPRPNIKRDTKLGIHLIHGEEGYTLNSTELRVVEWKFSELDLDHDNTLSFRELRSLRRVVRRVVRPRECARRFAKRCDSNKNRRLERKEWSLCMGINIGAFLNDSSNLAKPTESQPPSGSIMRLVTRRRQEKPLYRPQKCRQARVEAEKKNAEDPGTKVFVPQCSKDGLYQRQQCHQINNGEKLCFCMNPRTGEVMKGENNCQQVHRIRYFKGCPSSRKKRFLTEIMDRMVEDTKNLWRSDNSFLQLNVTSLVERAMRWKFYLLDLNRNGKLDKKEIRSFREEIKRNIRSKKRIIALDLRKCARNFLRYCDANSDRIITLKEMLVCSNIREF